LGGALGSNLHGSYVARGDAVAVAVLGAFEGSLVEGRAGLSVGRIYGRAASLGLVDLGQWIVVVLDGRQARVGAFTVAAFVQVARGVVAEVVAAGDRTRPGAVVAPRTVCDNGVLQIGTAAAVGDARAFGGGVLVDGDVQELGVAGDVGETAPPRLGRVGGDGAVGQLHGRGGVVESTAEAAVVAHPPVGRVVGDGAVVDCKLTLVVEAAAQGADVVAHGRAPHDEGAAIVYGAAEESLVLPQGDIFEQQGAQAEDAPSPARVGPVHAIPVDEREPGDGGIRDASLQVEVAVVHGVLDDGLVQARAPDGRLVPDVQVAGRRPLLGVGETVAVAVYILQGQQVGAPDQHHGIPAVEGVGLLDRRLESALPAPRLGRYVAPAVARLAVSGVEKLVRGEGVCQRDP